MAQPLEDDPELDRGRDQDRDAAPYARLEARLGHRFHDHHLLERALTHKSFLNERPEAVAAGREDNERLEFLGDALLGLLVGQLLMERFPERDEGELSKARAQIVSEGGLCAGARDLRLGEWLFLGRGEEQTGGRQKPSLLADACEALMAAVYLDGGIAVALAVARRLFAGAIEASDQAGSTDYKTRLQERAQARLKLQPRYLVLSAEGPDHDKTFEVSARLGEREYGRAKGRNKKEAEQRAAAAALAQLLDEA